jgi:putative ABC transport system ATP-binding protein
MHLLEALNATGVTLIVVTHDPSLGARARPPAGDGRRRLKSDSGAAE